MVNLSSLTFLFCILLFSIYTAYAQSPACSSYQSSIECNASPFCNSSIQYTNDSCRCVSNASLDILFMIDGSQSSLSAHDFALNKQWLQSTIIQDLSTQSKIGITIFGSTINESLPLQYWTSSELIERIQSLSYPSSTYTATASAILSAMEQFDRVHETQREKLLILQTGSNPCENVSISTPAGCPYSICQYKSILREAGIHTIIIDVGGNIMPDYVQCAADLYFIASNYSDLSINGLIDTLCTNSTLADTAPSHAITGATLINSTTLWTDDFQYDVNNSAVNQYAGVNWYPISTTGQIWPKTRSSSDVGLVHGWYRQCDNTPSRTACEGSQIIREFACNSLEDILNYSVTVSFDAYFACKGFGESNTSLIYSRYSATAGSYIMRTDDSNREFISEKSNPCDSFVFKIPVLDTFYVSHSEIISIAMWLNMIFIDESIAFNNFEVECKAITYNPTVAPTIEPTLQPTGNTSNPTLAPTYDPTQDPTSDPTQGPTFIPSMNPTETTSKPTSDPTQEPTFVPTINPTESTLGPTSGPTIDTNAPTVDPTVAVTTQEPTRSPTQYYGWLWFVCYYDDNDVDYYTDLMEVTQYAQIMRQQILDTIQEIDGFAVDYNVTEMNTESVWKKGGIQEFKICKVFEDETTDEDCSSYDINDENEDAEYVAIGMFDVIALNEVDAYKEHMTDIMESDSFLTTFNLNMIAELSEAMNVTERRRALLQSTFSALLIQITDESFMETTEFGDDDEVQTGIGVIVDYFIEKVQLVTHNRLYQIIAGSSLLVLCCLCIFCCFCCRKCCSNRKIQEKNALEGKTFIEMNVDPNKKKPEDQKKQFEPLGLDSPTEEEPGATPQPPARVKPENVKAVSKPKTYKKKVSKEVLKVTPMGLDTMSSNDNIPANQLMSRPKEVKKVDSASNIPDLPLEYDTAEEEEEQMDDDPGAKDFEDEDDNMNTLVNDDVVGADALLIDHNMVQDIMNAADEDEDEHEVDEKEDQVETVEDTQEDEAVVQHTPTPPARLPSRFKAKHSSSSSDSLDVLQHQYLADEINQEEDQELIAAGGHVTAGGPDDFGDDEKNSADEEDGDDFDVQYDT